MILTKNYDDNQKNYVFSRKNNSSENIFSEPYVVKIFCRIRILFPMCAF